MPWNPRFRKDHSFPSHVTVFDNTVGRLLHEGKTVGYLAFRLDQTAVQTGGALWWRRYSDPYDIVSFLEWIQPDTPDERMDDGRLTASEAEELDLNAWPVPAWQLETDPEPSEDWFEREPALLQIEFIEGAERDSAWKEFGWGDN